MIGSWMSNKEGQRRDWFFLRGVHSSIRGKSINKGDTAGTRNWRVQDPFRLGGRRQSKVRWNSRVQPKKDHQSTD